MSSPEKKIDVDLVISDVIVPDLAKLNEDLEISWKVTNQGKDTTSDESWHDNVFLSTDKFLGWGDYFVAKETHQKILQPSASYSVTTKGNIPNQYFLDYDLITKIDPNKDYYLIFKTDNRISG
ncbi:MAG: hypothetical protein ACRC2R_05375 [Xenococcaceae cyanobacterium]